MQIVLFEPEIPPNTGNIARTCAGTHTSLHLIRPLGFSIDDKMLKRAGLDYWAHVDTHYHDDYFDYWCICIVYCGESFECMCGRSNCCCGRYDLWLRHCDEFSAWFWCVLFIDHFNRAVAVPNVRFWWWAWWRWARPTKSSAAPRTLASRPSSRPGSSAAYRSSARCRLDLGGCSPRHERPLVAAALPRCSVVGQGTACSGVTNGRIKSHVTRNESSIAVEESAQMSEEATVI